MEEIARCLFPAIPHLPTSVTFTELSTCHARFRLSASGRAARRLVQDTTLCGIFVRGTYLIAVRDREEKALKVPSSRKNPYDSIPRFWLVSSVVLRAGVLSTY